MRIASIAVLLSLAINCAAAIPAAAQTYNESLLANLQWRNIGPLRGGRAITVTGVPGRPETFFFGAVGGGVWRTDNAGRTWAPVSDALPVASIGAIAVAPSNANVVYAGSGEADMRSDIQHGDGIYRSVDGGATWTHTGLDDTRQIGAIVVDPHDPNTLYVAALGHQYGPNAQRGVFKSTDGGRSWTKVLYRDADTGAIDVVMDPTDSTVLYASLWQTRRPPWNVYPPSNGPGSGLYKTNDAGKTWTHISGHGLPAGVLGRIGIAISPANPKRVYTTIDTNAPATGGIYRSDDGGATWTHTSNDSRIWKRGWYFGQITVDPKNSDVLYAMNTSTYRSTDAGRRFIAIKGAPGGDDYHALWIDPNDANRMILGSDQGVVISLDGAKAWSSWYNQSTAQLYHVITDNRFPYWVYGAQQDSGAIAVPSRSIHRQISMLDWRPIDVGGESGTIAPDPLHPGRLFGNPPTYEDVNTNWEINIDPTVKYPDTVWRSTWTMPIVASPQNARVLYMSRQKVFRSSDQGRSWHTISPDLTRQATSVPQTLDATTAADNNGLQRRGVVYWIAPSPVRAHQLWASTDDGYIWVTYDEGTRWQNVTPAQLTPWSKVGIIDASHFNAQTAYAAVDRHRLDDDRPYIYKTHDGGRNWVSIVHGLPLDESVNVVREDPKRPGLLFAGTERRVYISFDDGAQWQPLQLNLPPASMRDIVFNGDDIVLATHGRGIWILDNAASLREIHAAANVGAYLFTPAIAYRSRAGDDQGTPLPLDEPALPNPPNGATIDYALPRGAEKVVLQITDASGRVVRRWSSSDRRETVNASTYDYPAIWVPTAQPPSATAGAHRFVWDFQYANHVLAPPGTYRVQLLAGGTTSTRTLLLRRDPRYPATQADLKAQFVLAQAIADEQLRTARAYARVKHLLPTHPQLRGLAGEEPPTSPDDSVGKPARDFNSLRYVDAALQTLFQNVESGDARPTSDQYAAFSLLKAKAARAIAQAESVH